MSVLSAFLFFISVTTSINRFSFFDHLTRLMVLVIPGNFCCNDFIRSYNKDMPYLLKKLLNFVIPFYASLLHRNTCSHHSTFSSFNLFNLRAGFGDKRLHLFSVLWSSVSYCYTLVPAMIKGVTVSTNNTTTILVKKAELIVMFWTENRYRSQLQSKQMNAAGCFSSQASHSCMPEWPLFPACCLGAVSFTMSSNAKFFWQTMDPRRNGNWISAFGTINGVTTE